MRDLQELNVNEGGMPVTRAAPSYQNIEDFEGVYGVSLPESYLRFLRHANGGHPELDSFIPQGTSEDNRWSIDTFYHLGPNRQESGSVWLMAEEWRSVLGAAAIPFAQDGGGSQLYLDFETEEPSVKLCIHDQDFKTVGVADSFGSFVDLLHKDPDMI